MAAETTLFSERAVLPFNEIGDPPVWLAPGCNRKLSPMASLQAFAMLGRLVSVIFERSDGTLIISRQSEEDEDGEFSLDFRGPRLRIQSSRAHISEAFAQAIDWKREKRCPACGKLKPLDRFSYDRNTLGGRVYRCRDCERARLKRYYRKRKIGAS